MEVNVLPHTQALSHAGNKCFIYSKRRIVKTNGLLERVHSLKSKDIPTAVQWIADMSEPDQFTQ